MSTSSMLGVKAWESPLSVGSDRYHCVIPYDKWSHEHIRGLLTYMHYTNWRILYFIIGKLLSCIFYQGCITCYMPEHLSRAWATQSLLVVPCSFTSKYKKAQLSLTNPRDAKACQNCSNSTCLLRCRWQYWPIFIRLAVVASEIGEIPRNLLKIQTYGVQGHPRSSILVTIESPYVTSYSSLIVTLAVSATVFEIFTVQHRLESWGYQMVKKSCR